MAPIRGVAEDVATETARQAIGHRVDVVEVSLLTSCSEELNSARKPRGRRVSRVDLAANERMVEKHVLTG